MDVFNPGYIILICVALVLTIAFVLLMYTNIAVFMYVLFFYLVGFGIYMTVFLSRISKEKKDDNYFSVTAYINLFNIFLFSGLLVMYIIFRLVRNDVGKNASKGLRNYNSSYY